MRFSPDPTFAGLPTTIFTVMSDLARELGAINLGQGFPDSPGPEDVRRVAAEAVLSGDNQYPPMWGLPVLRRAVADHYTRHQGLTVDPEREVLITVGATEALAACFLSLLRPGDEVVLFQPLYDLYLPLVRRVGAIPKLVRLTPPHFALTEDALAEAFSPRTRMVVLNNPLNPAAIVHPRDQLERLARWCVAQDAIAICDEVWEHVVFDGRPHIPLMSLPGMAERSVKVGSAGKIFSLTGWKIGWAIAPPEITAVLARAHQFLSFTVPPSLQLAVAYGLGKEVGYFERMRAEFARSRDRLASGLRDAGYAVLPSEGTYFLNLDLAASGLDVDDRTFCERAVRECGVAAIPVSAFYDSEPVRSVVRLCFAKRDATLDAGIERLARARDLFA